MNPDNHFKVTIIYRHPAAGHDTIHTARPVLAKSALGAANDVVLALVRDIGERIFVRSVVSRQVHQIFTRADFGEQIERELTRCPECGEMGHAHREGCTEN